VQGGLGVFGSLVRLRFQALEVVVPQTEPATGFFDFVGTQFERSLTPYLSFDLYVESRATRAGGADALSGRYVVRPPFLGYPGCLVCGLLGTVRGQRVELALLNDWSARDTVEIFDGEVRGDTLVGTYRRRGGTVRFARER
jgi:hypothetical protein